MMLRLRKNIMQWERPVVAASVVPQLLYHQKCVHHHPAYCILGKDIKALMGKVGDVDCPIYQQT